MINENQNAINELAPCGLDCSRCVSYKNGDVVRLSIELKAALTNYEHVAEHVKHFNPIFNAYPEFMSILDYLTKGTCEGCHFTKQETPGCSIRACHHKHTVHFCCQCPDFPCTPTTYNPSLKETWLKNNQSILQKGIDQFYKEQKSKPRY